MRIPFFTAMLGLGSASALAAAPTILNRTSDWSLSYDQRSCDLGATFGAGEDQVAILFSRFEPSTRFNLTLAGKKLGWPTVSSDVTVDFGPTENPHPARAYNGTVGTIPSMSIDNLRLDDANLADHVALSQPVSEDNERKVEMVTFTLPGKRTIKLRLGSMAKPMHALRDCTDGLVKEWGFNVNEQRAAIVGTKPWGNTRSWVRPEDYPGDMWKQGRSAIVRFRLDIGENGKVTSCHSYTFEKAAEFGKVTCRLLSMRGRFSPALSHDGKPMPSFFVGTLNWLMR